MQNQMVKIDKTQQGLFGLMEFFVQVARVFQCLFNLILIQTSPLICSVQQGILEQFSFFLLFPLSLFLSQLFAKLELLALSSQWHLGEGFHPNLKWLSDNIGPSGHPSSVTFIMLRSQSCDRELQVTSERNELRFIIAIISQNNACGWFVISSILWHKHRLNRCQKFHTAG